jgi:uncharacterized RDD family membrane protein YckC
MNYDFHNSKIDAGTRLGTMLLDHIFMTMIAMVFFIPEMISNFSGAFDISHEQTAPSFLTGPFVYIGLLGFAIYLCKDCINGRSVAKRILKLQVVDNLTGKVASPIKCFVRNIFCFLWPIEVIVALTNTSRRIGDRIAGTKLVYFDPTIEQPQTSFKDILLPIALAYILLLLILIPLKGSMQSFAWQKVEYSEASFNQKESSELEQLLTDSLGQYFTPSVKIYDTIQNQKSKYISTILLLKENYLESQIDYEKLSSMTNNLIYSKFPESSFTGKLKYIYKGPAQMQSRTIKIGTNSKSKN